MTVAFSSKIWFREKKECIFKHKHADSKHSFDPFQAQQKVLNSNNTKKFEKKIYKTATNTRKQNKN